MLYYVICECASQIVVATERCQHEWVNTSHCEFDGKLETRDV